MPWKSCTSRQTAGGVVTWPASAAWRGGRSAPLRTAACRRPGGRFHPGWTAARRRPTSSSPLRTRRMGGRPARAEAGFDPRRFRHSGCRAANAHRAVLRRAYSNLAASVQPDGAADDCRLERQQVWWVEASAGAARLCQRVLPMLRTLLLEIDDAGMSCGEGGERENVAQAHDQPWIVVERCVSTALRTREIRRRGRESSCPYPLGRRCGGARYAGLPNRTAPLPHSPPPISRQRLGHMEMDDAGKGKAAGCASRSVECSPVGEAPGGLSDRHVAR